MLATIWTCTGMFCNFCSDAQTFKSTAEILAHIDQRYAEQPDAFQFEWSCVETGVYSKEWDAGRVEWIDAAYKADWDAVLKIAVRTEELGRYANSAGLKGTASARNPFGYTALHLAAWHGASVDIVQGLLKLGAARSVRTVDDKKQRALDIARDQGHAYLYDILTPHGLPDVSDEDLAKVEAHFHEVIIEAMGTPTPESMRLPDLGLLRDHSRIWMPVPGMYGGFNFWWEDGHLVTESFSRVCGGSGRTYHITPAEAKLVDEGWG